MSRIVQYFLLIIAVNISGSLSQFLHDACTNPEGISGVCINIHYCDTLENMLHRKPPLPQDVKFLQASYCGSEGPRQPKVCCTDLFYPEEVEAQAVTNEVPTDANHPLCRNRQGIEGLCVSIRTCPSLRPLLSRQPFSPEDRQILQDSQCSSEGGYLPKVCCTEKLQVLSKY